MICRPLCRALCVVVSLLPFWLRGAAPAAVEAAAVRAELERVEDVRILHAMAVQDLHDAKALAVYLRGWGGPDRAREVEDRFIEAECLYGVCRAADHGATGLQADLDVRGADAAAADAAALALGQRVRAEAASRVAEFADRAAAFRQELAAQVTAAAAGKAQWTLTSEPLPWPDPPREAGRQQGLRFGWALNEHVFKTIPENELPYLLAKGRKMGLTCLNLSWTPACNWGAIETAPGQYDFAALDRILSLAADHGLTVAVMLHSLTGTPPAWHLEKAGADSQFRRTVPERQKPGTTRTETSGINLFHAPTGEAYAAFLAACARHLREKWPQVVEGVYVEGGQREIEAVADESAAMDAFWRTWSKSDTPWRTPESLAASAPADAAAYARAEACREAWLLDYVARIRTALKQAWPELPVQNPTFSDDFHRMHGGVTGSGRDAPRLMALADNPGSASDSPANFALLASFGAGRWFWQTGIHSGCGTTGGAAGVQPPLYDATRLMLGSPNFSLRAAFPQAWFRYADRQIGGFGITSYMLTPRRTAEYAPVLLNTALPRPDVAVLWSQTSLRRDRNRDLWRSAMAFGHLLRRIHVAFDYVAEDGLAASLQGRRVLILSDTQSLPLPVCEIIRGWVRDGGTLLAFGAPGLYDENGTRRASLPLADVLGADLARLRTPAPVEPDGLYTGHPEGSFLQPPTYPWQFAANLPAVLKPATGTARAWYAGVEKDVAVVENRFGQGQALFCGYPVGFLYREAIPYEFAYGLSHNRTLSYNAEGNRYEAWVTAELEKRGVVRVATVPYGRMLRAQLRDDGDWFHITSNGPSFREYHIEEDRPARTIYTVVRRREGCDNLYVALHHTEGNYFWERGHFRSTLGGGELTVSVALPAAPAGAGTGKPVVFDARLRVPVPHSVKGGRAEFATWVPAAQGSLFAVAPAGAVRLFGDPAIPGEPAAAIAARVTASASGQRPLAGTELVDVPAITAFLQAHRGQPLLVGCGSTRFRPAAEALAAWLKRTWQIDATLTHAGPRTVIRKAYMDGFGYNHVLPLPLQPEILLGNCQENATLWEYLLLSGACRWLPAEVNDDFPGAGRALVMLSFPVATEANGKTGGKPVAAQLVIGASDPSAALAAVETLARRRWPRK